MRLYIVIVQILRKKIYDTESIMPQKPCPWYDLGIYRNNEIV